MPFPAQQMALASAAAGGVFDQRAAIDFGMVAPSGVTGNTFDVGFYEEIATHIEDLPGTTLGWGYGPHVVTRIPDQSARIDSGHDVIFAICDDGHQYTPNLDLVGGTPLPHFANSTTNGQHCSMYTTNSGNSNSPGDRVARVIDQSLFVLLDENENPRSISDSFQFLDETFGAGFWCVDDTELDTDGDAIAMLRRHTPNSFHALTVLDAGATNGELNTVGARLAFMPQTLNEANYDPVAGGWAAAETTLQWLAGNYTGL